MNEILHSPLLYYGGKRWLLPTLLEMIPADTESIVSPFIGGGALELNLAALDFKLICYDLHEPLINFWQHFLSDPSLIVQSAESKLLLMAPDDIGAMDVSESINHLGFNGAVWFYVFNHLCYNGMAEVSGKYMREYYVRDDQTIVFVEPANRLVFPNKHMWKSLSKMELSINCLDFRHSLELHTDTFAYLDPPYPGNDSMYLDGKQTFPHVELCDILHSRDKWLLSYSDEQWIRDMYSSYSKRVVTRKTKHPKNELLIMSDDVYESFESSKLQMTLF